MKWLFTISIFLILYHYILYPILLAFIAIFKKDKIYQTNDNYPSVTLLIVVHNGENLIVEKIKNSINLKYPRDKIEIIIASDGSDDRTAERTKPFINNGIRFFDYPIHEGKIAAINKTVTACKGEIIVFSDIDAQLHRDAILKLIARFTNPKIGGVCGKKCVIKEKNIFSIPQVLYVSYENFIKKMESKISNIATNTGILYAIRKQLFTKIPDSVTDDLFNALNVVKQGYRFVYEPDAKAFILAPSQNPQHEVERRRRIVSQSLRGLWYMKRLLNPFKYGFFSVMLFSHKILRRLIPIFLLILFFSSFYMSFKNKAIALFFILQLFFYSQALVYHLNITPSWLRKLTSVSYYFYLGNLGTFLGLMDFIRGKKISKWEPRT